METDRATACCFSGPRPHNSGLPFTPDVPGYDELQQRVATAIEKTISDGYTTFYTGMAQGFDILCGEAVVRLRDEAYGGIRLIAALPFVKQADGWGALWKGRYHRLLSQCDASVVAAPDTIPTNSRYLERNHYMVDHTSRMICYLVGNPLRSGTAATVRYAQKQASYQIINLACPLKHDESHTSIGNTIS